MDREITLFNVMCRSTCMQCIYVQLRTSSLKDSHDAAKARCINLRPTSRSRRVYYCLVFLATQILEQRSSPARLVHSLLLLLSSDMKFLNTFGFLPRIPCMGLLLLTFPADGVSSTARVCLFLKENEIFYIIHWERICAPRCRFFSFIFFACKPAFKSSHAGSFLSVT